MSACQFGALPLASPPRVLDDIQEGCRLTVDGKLVDAGLYGPLAFNYDAMPGGPDHVAFFTDNRADKSEMDLYSLYVSAEVHGAATPATDVDGHGLARANATFFDPNEASELPRPFFRYMYAKSLMDIGPGANQPWVGPPTSTTQYFFRARNGQARGIFEATFQFSAVDGLRGGSHRVRLEFNVPYQPSQSS